MYFLAVQHVSYLAAGVGKFDGPKKYFAKTTEGYVEVDNETAEKMIEAGADQTR